MTNCSVFVVTVWARCLGPFNELSYYIKWVKTSRTYSKWTRVESSSVHLVYKSPFLTSPRDLLIERFIQYSIQVLDHVTQLCQ